MVEGAGLLGRLKKVFDKVWFTQLLIDFFKFIEAPFIPTTCSCSRYGCSNRSGRCSANITKAIAAFVEFYDQRRVDNSAGDAAFHYQITFFFFRLRVMVWRRKLCWHSM